MPSLVLAQISPQPHSTSQNCVAYAFTDGFFHKSPVDRRDRQGTPPFSPLARNRITMAIMIVVILTYMAYVVHTVVVMAVPLVVFSPALVVPFLVVPLLTKNVPLLVINTTSTLLSKLTAKLNGVDGKDRRI